MQQKSHLIFVFYLCVWWFWLFHGYKIRQCSGHLLGFDLVLLKYKKEDILIKTGPKKQNLQSQKKKNHNSQFPEFSSSGDLGKREFKFLSLVIINCPPNCCFSVKTNTIYCAYHCGNVRYHAAVWCWLHRGWPEPAGGHCSQRRWLQHAAHPRSPSGPRMLAPYPRTHLSCCAAGLQSSGSHFSI